MPELAPVRKTTCPAVWEAARAGVELWAGVELQEELELCFVALSIAVGGICGAHGILSWYGVLWIE